VEKLLDKVNLLGGGIVALLSAIFGQLWFLFAGLLVLNFADWITGWRAANKANECSSKIGAKGIAKKVGYWLVIAVSFFIGFIFQELGQVLNMNLNFMNCIGWFVLANYLVNESRSILENLIRLNVPVQPFLVRGLKTASEWIDKAADVQITHGKKDNDNKNKEE